MIIKNSNLRTILAENRYKILAIIIAIILILCVIRLLNEMAKNANRKTENTVNIETSTTYKPQETILQGENVPDFQQEKNDNVMENFIKYCNKKEIQKAYNLLTDECKEILFNSDIQNFEKDYINKIFTNEKSYTMKSWIKTSNSYTYKVKIMEDMLSTGKVNEAVEDYYTIVNKNGENKLNINSYVGRIAINKIGESNNVKVTVIHKDIFMDYETYNIKVENNSEKTILLDSKQAEKTVYVTSNNNTKFSAFIYEINENYLKIKPRIYRNITIKFNKIYNINTTSKSMSFTNIIKDEEKYNKLQDKSDYKDILEITIDL